MSINSQIIAAIIISSILSVSGGVIATTYNNRVYLQEQLAHKNQDNAALLAISIGRNREDIETVKIMMTAQFDSGYYKKISFVDHHGSVVFEKSADDASDTVPIWFRQLLPINVPSGIAAVNNGWQQLGTLVIQSQSGFAYQALWDSTIHLCVLMASTSLLVITAGFIGLRRLKQQLQQLVIQASAIQQKHFYQIDEPEISELKQLAQAMNFTVTRLQQLFDDEAQRIEALKAEAYFDPLTRLYNRKPFIAYLQEAMISEQQPFAGCIVFRVHDINELNINQGRHFVDKQLIGLAQLLSKYAEEQEYSLAARLNGADFCLAVAAGDLEQVANKLLNQIHTRLSSTITIHIGWSLFATGMSLEQFLINMDMSLAKSEAFGNFIDRLEDDSNQELPLTMHEWREVISHALHSQYLLLLEYPIQNNIRQVIHHEIVIRIKQTEQGEWITARKFIPFAERLKLISKLDIFVLQTIIARLHHESTLKRYAINVSVQTLLSPEFDDLLADLSSESRSVLNRIAIELPEYGVNKHADKIKIKLREIRLLGMQIGVDHFSVKSAKMLQILDNEIDFIKIDALFIRQLDVNSLNKQFLLSVINIAHQLDIDVIAKGVDDESQVPLLFELGFDGVTGAVIDA